MNLQIKRPDHLGTYEGEHYPNNVVVGGQYLLVNIVWGGIIHSGMTTA